MSLLLVLGTAVAGLLVGHVVNRLAVDRSWRGSGDTAPVSDVSPPDVHDRRGVAVRLPWLELAAAGLFVVVGLRFGWAAELPAWLWFAAGGLLLAVIDLREKLLPNRVMLPLAVGLVLLLIAAAAAGDAWPALLRAGVAGVVSFAVALGMALLAPAGLGMGDVKLAAPLGLVLGWLGWPVVLVGFFLGFLVQAVVGLGLLAVRRAGRRTELPFGPALLAGALLGALLTGGWSAL